MIKKIYFAGSIRGGRNDIELYQQIINYLQRFGEVLTEHIGNKQISGLGESGMTDQEIFRRDIEWLSSSDYLIAEVTVPSLGVGFEIARAVELQKNVLCLYRIQPEKKLSAMIAGCSEIEVKEYESFEDLKLIIDHYFSTYAHSRRLS